MRHSTLVPWLQKGQLKTVSSLSIRFFGGAFALDFLLPITQILIFNSKQKFSEKGKKKKKNLCNYTQHGK